METQPTNPSHDPIIWRQAKARVGFKMHLRTYLIVISGIWLVWAITSFLFWPGGFKYPWPIWATFGWGIGLASHYFSVYYGGNEKSMIDREYEKLVDKKG